MFFQSLFGTNSNASTTLDSGEHDNRGARLTQSETSRDNNQTHVTPLSELRKTCPIQKRTHVKHNQKSDPLKASRTDFSLGVYYLRTQSNLELAKKHVESAHNLRLMWLGPNHALLASSHEILGEIEKEYENIDRAIQHYNKALTIIDVEEAKNEFGSCGMVANVIQNVEKGDFDISKIKMRAQKNLRLLQRKKMASLGRNEEKDLNTTGLNQKVQKNYVVNEENDLRESNKTKTLPNVVEYPSTTGQVADSPIIAKIKCAPSISSQIEELPTVQPQIISSKEEQGAIDACDFSLVKASVVTKEPENVETLNKISQAVAEIHFQPDLGQTLKISRHDSKSQHRSRSLSPNRIFQSGKNQNFSPDTSFVSSDIYFKPHEEEQFSERRRSMSVDGDLLSIPNDLRETKRETWIEQQNDPTYNRRNIDSKNRKDTQTLMQKSLKEKIKKKLAKSKAKMLQQKN